MIRAVEDGFRWDLVQDRLRELTKPHLNQRSHRVHVVRLLEDLLVHLILQLSNIGNISSQSEDAFGFEAISIDQRPFHQRQHFRDHQIFVLYEFQCGRIGTKHASYRTHANVEKMRLCANHHCQLEIEIHLILHIRLELNFLIFSRGNGSCRGIGVYDALSRGRRFDLVFHFHRLVVGYYNLIASFATFCICS